MTGENTEKPALPPTPTRIRLGQDIAGELVKCWHFRRPVIHRLYDDRDVTPGVREFERHGLADRGKPGDIPTSIVSLTPAGEEWLNRYESDECPHCGIGIHETPTRRDTRHDHCGPLPHTGSPRGPYCERCR